MKATDIVNLSFCSELESRGKESCNIDRSAIPQCTRGIVSLNQFDVNDIVIKHAFKKLNIKKNDERLNKQSLKRKSSLFDINHFKEINN